MGIDTGGTFTDLVALDDKIGQIYYSKCPSTPETPGRAVINALIQSEIEPKSISLLVLGTTVGTNALLQRQGARVIYLTTKGFEDIPYIQRVDKKDPYDLQWEKPLPFVQRRDCLGINERVSSEGEVLIPLTSEELQNIKIQVDELLQGQTDNVALTCNLLFSFANPDHEKLLKKYFRQNYPELPISISSEVSPIWREYERASTTIIDSYLKPLMNDFIKDLESRLMKKRYEGVFAVMKSNGGQMLATAAKDQPVHTMLSGLSGGVIGGQFFGKLVERDNVITFDMGGTSTDVATIIDGDIRYTTEHEVDFNIPVSAPIIELNTIGAGGGSIAWIDKGGLLRVGPQSAGAVPGPVCYGKGGQQVTVTDANLVLGRLNPEYFLGGEMELKLDEAKEKITELGNKLNLTLEETAQAIIDIAIENMANAIRVLTIERGIDPRDFSLVGFGGAGPLHAVEVAKSLKIQEIVIPPHPGLTSAFGTLVADLRVDKRWTHYHRSDNIDLIILNEQLNKLVSETQAELKNEGFDGTPIIQRSVGMRYSGQNYERDFDLPPGEITPKSIQVLMDEFHREHQNFYGYHFPDEVIELIHFNVTAIGKTKQPELPILINGSDPTPNSVRKVYFKNDGYLNCPIYRRDDLSTGSVINGPSIIEELDSTTLVHPNQSLTISPEGILIIKWEKKTRQDSGEATTNQSKIDSVTLAIINNNLVNITREMGTAMMHTAYSPIFSESKDFSCALFNNKGEMIAQGEFCPAQLGAIPHTVKWTISELGLDSFEQGDVVIHNDPYRGGCHMPEHMMLKPIFYNGELVAFAALIGHLAEIGAMAVGSFASNATDVFQEGLRLPPLKIMERGEHVKDIWRLILANHRTPRNTWGDLHAMLGALNVADHRLMDLMDKYGAHYILRATDELINYSERLMREEIQAIPNGEYTFEERMEDDGITNIPYIIKANVVVRNGKVLVDFTGSDRQAEGPINATYGVTTSATYNAFLQLTSSEIPRNAGCYRPIKIIAPPGTIVNVKYPGPSVGGNTETQPRIVSAILGALRHVLPEKIMAAEGTTSCNFLFGGVHPKTGQYYVHYHFEASGWGGRCKKDGNSAQNHIHGNCRNTPVEIFETLFPFLIKSYGLNQDSGGPGTHRGGLGTYRIFEVLAPKITVSVMMDHVKEGAWGTFGGDPGGLAGIWIKRTGDPDYQTFPEAFDTVSPSKFANVIVSEGDEIKLQSAGGGGYGKPEERDPVLVKKDLDEGFVSLQAAKQFYSLNEIDDL
jgi:N-methylhydantoinase A/oxoprolinase/acetone carboxylase beta subunit/N-methylhydantoinase B/oxoprolinase/acetone carboxylase alpha subunit